MDVRRKGPLDLLFSFDGRGGGIYCQRPQQNWRRGSLPLVIEGSPEPSTFSLSRKSSPEKRNLALSPFRPYSFPAAAAAAPGDHSRGGTKNRSGVGGVGHSHSGRSSRVRPPPSPFPLKKLCPSGPPPNFFSRPFFLLPFSASPAAVLIS